MLHFRISTAVIFAFLLSACGGKGVTPPDVSQATPSRSISHIVVRDANSDAAKDWPMYGRDLRHSFSNPYSLITPSNVAQLKLAWSFPTGDAVSASPIVKDGVIYVGSWDGNFYAVRERTGALVWRFSVDCQNTIVPTPARCLTPGASPPPRYFSDGGLITSSAAAVDDSVYFAGGKTLYNLNAKNGSLRWKRVICGNPEEADCASDPQDTVRIFSSPVVFQGLVFIGHSSVRPGLSASDNHYRGAFEAIDAATGQQRWRFEVDPTRPNNRGCGNVWSSAAVDDLNHLVYFGTADCNNAATPPYHNAIIALQAETGAIKWVFRPHGSDPNSCDLDFGAAPNVLDFGGGRYLGEGGKDGTYYLLNRLTGNLVWSHNVVFGGALGGFYGSSFDGTHIFAATGLGDGDIVHQTGLCNPSDPRDTFLQEPSMHTLDVANGNVAWEKTQNHSFAPTSIANGVVFSSLVGIDGFGLNAYDPNTGNLAAHIPMTSSVNAAPTPLRDMLFVTAGNSTDGQGGGIFAFALGSLPQPQSHVR